MKRLPKNIPLPPTESPTITKLHILQKIINEKILSSFTKIGIHHRHNLLTTTEILKTYLKLRKGDILLTGNFNTPINLIVPGALTHAALYLGRGKIIHAIRTGVEYNTVKHVLKQSDTIVILRLPQNIKNKHRIIKKTIQYAKQQLGKPYENFFKEDKSHFFCTELVNEAYKYAGHNTKLKSIKPFRTTIEKMEKNILDVTHWLKPIEFLNSNFRIIYHSRNLAYNGKEILIRADRIQQKLSKIEKK